MPAQIEQLVDCHTAWRLALTLDRKGPDSAAAAWVEGRSLPLGWHVVYCQESPSRDEMSPDGLPANDASLPAHAYKQRLFGGATVEVSRPPRLGEILHCEVVPGNFTEKQGSSGPLVIYEFERRYRVGRELCLREVSRVLYRDNVPINSDSSKSQKTSSGSASSDSWRTLKRTCIDEVDVFRFSALMFNSHRVHYDLAYATTIDRHPGVLVQAKLLLLLALDCLPAAVQQRSSSMRYRSHSALVAPAQVEVQGQVGSGGELCALRVINGNLLCLSIDF